MGAGHSHAGARAEDRGRLRWVLLLTASVAAFELVGAWLSGSLALLADAGHLLTDAGAIVLALAASLLATRPASARRTYGYHRAEILAALVNAVVLLGLCVFLAVEGIQRLREPAEVEGPTLLVFAVIGLVANGVALMVLAARDRTNLNMRGVQLEVLSDTFGSVAAVAAGVAVAVWEYHRADAIASLVIAVLIVPRALSLARESVGVLLEGAPPGVSVDEIRQHLCRVDGVLDVHDLHAWQITSGMPALSAHVRVSDEALANRGVGEVLDELSDCVAACFGIEHATFQVEPASHREHEHLGEQRHL